MEPAQTHYDIGKLLCRYFYTGAMVADGRSDPLRDLIRPFINDLFKNNAALRLLLLGELRYNPYIGTSQEKVNYRSSVLGTIIPERAKEFSVDGHRGIRTKEAIQYALVGRNFLRYLSRQK